MMIKTMCVSRLAAIIHMMNRIVHNFHNKNVFFFSISQANSDADHKESSSDEDSDIEEQKSKRKKSNESDASDGYKPNGVKSDSDSADFKPKKRKIIGRSAKRNSNASNSDNSPDTR